MLCLSELHKGYGQSLMQSIANHAASLDRVLNEKPNFFTYPIDLLTLQQAHDSACAVCRAILC